MIYELRKDYEWYAPEHANARRDIIVMGEKEGASRAETDYPYAIYREQNKITELAQPLFQKFWGLIEKASEGDARMGGNWRKKLAERVRSQKGEAQRLFVSAFVGSYLDYVQKEDAKRAPQPAATPATPSNIATLKGVTLTLKDVDHNADECVYLLKIEDPNYIDEPYEQEWVVPLVDTTVSDTTTSSTSSSYGASSTSLGRMTSSSSEAYEARSSTPQKPRKPLGGYFRKPQ